jgi:hypothetical protein
VLQGLRAQSLPKEKVLQFTIKDSISTFKGDDLFFLIDGGAEVYLEYGFIQVWAADYGFDKQSVHIELYEMATQDAAWGIFSLRKPIGTTHNQQPDAVSQAKDYLMAYDNNYYLVISGLQDSLILNDIANSIFPKLTNSHYKPQLVNFVTQKLPETQRTVFAKGTLALSNVFQFGYGMLTDFKEACALQVDRKLIIVIQYNGKEEAQTAYSDFVSKARTTERYQLKSELKNSYVFVNKQGYEIEIVNPETNLLEFTVYNPL